MRTSILRIYASTLQLATQLVADVACERFAEQPFDGAKHPAWVLGHLGLASGMVLDELRGNPGGFGGVPEAWAEASMPGDACRCDRSLYAEKDVLLTTLASIHGGLASTFESAADKVLATEFPVEEWRSLFPTIGDAAVYVMAHHEGYHLGQLSQWRRERAPGRGILISATIEPVHSEERDDMTAEKAKNGTVPPGEVFEMAGLVEYGDGAIVSRTLLKGEAGTMTLFAFDAGQGLSEHSAPFDAFVQVLDGGGEFTIGGHAQEVRVGQAVLLPANIPHAVQATGRLKMLLTMFRR